MLLETFSSNCKQRIFIGYKTSDDFNRQYFILFLNFTSIKKDVFSSSHERGTKKNSESP